MKMKLTREQYEDLEKKLWAQAGLELGGDAGKLSKDGVTASYDFDGETLTIQVLHHPFLVTKDYCEKQIKDALAAQGYVAE